MKVLLACCVSSVLQDFSLLLDCAVCETSTLLILDLAHENLQSPRRRGIPKTLLCWIVFDVAV